MRPRALCMVDLSLAPEALAPVRQVADVDELPIDRDLLIERIGEYDAYWGHLDIQVDREAIERATRLKVVATASTGTDHLDKPLLRERGIALLDIKTEYDLLDTFTATAECAWGLLLACLRRIPAASRAVRGGRWPIAGFIGSQLSGKTLGVLGVGRLGRMVVEYGKAFRMRVIGCDPREFHIAGVEQVAFDDFLAQSDAITIHVHLDETTRGLVSREAFARMKDGVVIVNTSRGALIDEAAFLDALESGKVAAAGLDVIHGEWMSDIGQHPLVQYAQQHDNVVIVPHMGGATVESIAGARVFMGKKLARYLERMRKQADE